MANMLVNKEGINTQNDGVLTIATGRSRKELEWKNGEILWSELVKKLSKTTRTRETFGEYKTLPKAHRDEIKDVGGVRIVGKFIDINGQRFGRLRVIERAPNDKNKLTMWHCLCDCGTAITTRSQDLRRGVSRSCGCLKVEELNARSHKHGMVGTRPYRIWKNMKTRCYNSRTKAYADYGGRGITVCERWKNSFENFWADMRPSYAPGLEIDRKDSKGNYCPENCRWVSKTVQNRNTRANHFVDSPLGRMTIAELSERSGLDYGTLKRRVYKGWQGSQLIGPVKRTQKTVKA